MASESIRLDGALVGKARIIGNALSRSPEKQIEHWAKIGRMMEDNAIKSLIANPLLGQQKKGDLVYLRVFKFKLKPNLQIQNVGWLF